MAHLGLKNQAGNMCIRKEVLSVPEWVILGRGVGRGFLKKHQLN